MSSPRGVAILDGVEPIEPRPADPPSSSGPNERQLLAKATRYLARYAASRIRLRAILQRYATKFNQDDERGLDPGAASRIEAVLDRCAELGWLDDRRFAAARARRLLARGHPPHIVRAKLVELGVGGKIGGEAVAELEREPGDAELQAAIGLARRRGLGPWARMPVDEVAKRKQLAVMARAGFSARVALLVVGARSVEELTGGG